MYQYSSSRRRIVLADTAHVTTIIPAESRGHARRGDEHEEPPTFGGDEPSFDVEAPPGSFGNPYPPDVVPAEFLAQLRTPAGTTPSPLLASKQPHNIARAELPDIAPLPVRKRSFKNEARESFNPQIKEIGIEPGRFYRKRAGQRCASAPQPGGSTQRQPGEPSTQRARKSDRDQKVLGRQEVSSQSRARPTTQFPSIPDLYPTAVELSHMSSQQQSAWGISATTSPKVQSNQLYSHGTTQGGHTHGSPSYGAPSYPSALPELNPTKPPCVMCLDQPATTMTEAGAFCDECWTAARQAARETFTPALVDAQHSDWLNQQTTMENGRRNRRVSFTMPRSSKSYPSELDVNEAVCVICGQGHGIMYSDAGRLCQVCWREVISAELRQQSGWVPKGPYWQS